MAGINGGWVVSPGQNSARYQDTGQGASGRILSWEAWTEDKSIPATALTQSLHTLQNAEQTILWRTSDNIGIGIPPNVTRLPLGQGGVGSWTPVLQGDSNGATSGGDHAFFLSP